jgi:flagellin-like hook-associated protein FlgL
VATGNTLGVAQAIQALARTAQVNGVNAFQASSVVIGRFKDCTNVVPCVEITAESDDTERYAYGGRINDGETFLLEVTYNNDNSQSTEQTIYQARDSIVSIFHTYAKLNSTPGVEQSHIVKGSGKWGYTYRNGQWWRCWQMKLHVRYEYSVVIQP